MTDVSADNVVAMPPTDNVRWADSYVNLLAGLGVEGRDKFTAQNYVFNRMTILDLENAYRGDWIARKAVEIPAWDMTRQWRSWEADQDQITLLEATEKKLQLQQKVQQTLIKARLYGGAAIIIGVDAGNPAEELNLDDVGKDSLKFLHVVSRNQINPGPLVLDISSKYFGQPQYYSANNIPVDKGFQQAQPTDLSFSKVQVQLHPSRVVRMLGADIADQQLNEGWGDSILQAVNDAIKMCGLVTGSLATLVAEMKIDIISVPELKSILSTKAGTDKLIARFMAANAAKSVVNTVLIDGNEKWQRVNAQLGGFEQIVVTYLQMASGAVDIPAGRFLGLPHRGLNVTGEADFRNYYDRLASEQKVTLEPAMNILDEVIIRSALGTRPPEIWYEWNSLWQLSDGDKADLALKKAQAYQIDVNAGQIPPVALANARANQLIEDGVYPGLEQALDEAAMEGDTIEEQNAPQPLPAGTLLMPGERAAPPDPNAPPLPPAGPPSPPSNPGQIGQLPANARRSTFPGGRGAGDANPYHDPATGKFTSGPGGPKEAPEPRTVREHINHYVEAGKSAIRRGVRHVINEIGGGVKGLTAGAYHAAKEEVAVEAVKRGLKHVVGQNKTAAAVAAVRREFRHAAEGMTVSEHIGHVIAKGAIRAFKVHRAAQAAAAGKPHTVAPSHRPSHGTTTMRGHGWSPAPSRHPFRLPPVRYDSADAVAVMSPERTMPPEVVAELDRALELLSEIIDDFLAEHQANGQNGQSDFNPNHDPHSGQFSSEEGGGEEEEKSKEGEGESSGEGEGESKPAEGEEKPVEGESKPAEPSTTPSTGTSPSSAKPTSEEKKAAAEAKKAAAAKASAEKKSAAEEAKGEKAAAAAEKARAAAKAQAEKAAAKAEAQAQSAQGKGSTKGSAKGSAASGGTSTKSGGGGSSRGGAAAKGSSPAKMTSKYTAPKPLTIKIKPAKATAAKSAKAPKAAKVSKQTAAQRKASIQAQLARQRPPGEMTAAQWKIEKQRLRAELLKIKR